MKEIGGYFGLEKFISNEFYKDCIALNTGRNALQYLIRAYKIKKIFIPYYLCESVGDVCLKNNIEMEYYFITRDFIPKFEKKLKSHEYLYIVNYFGQLTNDYISSMKKQFCRIIVDNTQSFFQRPVLGLDTIYTCRKYFGVPDGAYLYTNSKLMEKIDIDVSGSRMAHIIGRFEGIAEDHYYEFKKMNNY